MPQIYVILSSPRAERMYCPGQAIDTFLHSLFPIVEQRFGIEGKNDVAMTVIEARRTTNEADIQMEIRYTAGEDEYGTGQPFDPSVEVQRELIEEIGAMFTATAGVKNSAPPLKLSVWCKPHYHSVFKSFG